MLAFILAAAVMAALAAASVAVPLLRDPTSRKLGAVAALLIAGTSAGLYMLWSTWDWNAPASAQAAGPDVIAMVAKLEKRLADQPNDLDGWLMLGRSYDALGRLDDAIVAFNHAHQLDAKSVEATIGLGEALSIKAGGEVTTQAAQLFESAIAQEPANPRALLFGGFAAAVLGNRPLARTRWEALKALHPPPEVVQMLDARIAELGVGSSGGTTADAGPGGGAAGPGDGAAGSVDPMAKATLHLTIAPQLKSRLTADAPLFVFAREPGSRGPPLAAKRLTSAAIGSQIELSQADSMVPGHALVGGQKVSITARVSFSGQPTPAAGDLYGELSYVVGADGIRELVIDRVAE